MSITLTGPNDFRKEVSVKLYSDGTPLIKMADFDKAVLLADTMILRPGSLKEFTEAMFLVDAFTDHGGWIAELILPYVPGARQDRSNPTGDVLFSLKSVANMINYRNFYRVLVLDPHSPETPALIQNSAEFPLLYLADKVWKGYSGIISADKGGRARAQAFGVAMKLPVFYGSKERDVATGRLTGFGVDALPQGGHYLVVDDICDGGGTFIGLAEKIAEQNCFADLFVTHGIFSKGTKDLLKSYKTIYTTDSRDFRSKGVHTIPIMQEMENYR